MSNKYIFTILGGDKRQAIIAKKLLSLGHTVRIFGLGSFSSDVIGADIFLSPQKALYGCDFVILPLPVSRDNIHLNLPSSDKQSELALCDIIKLVSKNNSSVILGGVIPHIMSDAARHLGVDIHDYYKQEALQAKNALPSAEGSIMLVMENTDKTVEGMNVLISGYGRIGFILAQKMKALGANVTVAARRDEILCEITMRGYHAVKTDDTEQMIKAIENSDVILNTVPSQIFSNQIISTVSNDPLYIEIASSPGGIDTFTAKNKGWNIIFAPSLPGRYAPESAGEYIFETILNIISKRGFNI